MSTKQEFKTELKKLFSDSDENYYDFLYSLNLFYFFLDKPLRAIWLIEACRGINKYFQIANREDINFGDFVHQRRYFFDCVLYEIPPENRVWINLTPTRKIKIRVVLGDKNKLQSLANKFNLNKLTSYKKRIKECLIIAFGKWADIPTKNITEFGFENPFIQIIQGKFDEDTYQNTIEMYRNPQIILKEIKKLENSVDEKNTAIPDDIREIALQIRTTGNSESTKLRNYLKNNCNTIGEKIKMCHLLNPNMKVKDMVQIFPTVETVIYKNDAYLKLFRKRKSQ